VPDIRPPDGGRDLRVQHAHERESLHRVCNAERLGPVQVLGHGKILGHTKPYAVDAAWTLTRVKMPMPHWNQMK
jgi:hypothetical protein